MPSPMSSPPRSPPHSSPKKRSEREEDGRIWIRDGLERKKAMVFKGRKEKGGSFINRGSTPGKPFSMPGVGDGSVTAALRPGGSQDLVQIALARHPAHRQPSGGAQAQDARSPVYRSPGTSSSRQPSGDSHSQSTKRF